MKQLPKSNASNYNEIMNLVNDLDLKNTNVEIKNNKILVSGDKRGYHITSEIKKLPNLIVKTESKLKIPDRKSDLENEVKELAKEGYKQIEIARILGISQSLVSKLQNS